MKLSRNTGGVNTVELEDGSFNYISGKLYNEIEGLKETIRKRNLLVKQVRKENKELKYFIDWRNLKNDCQSLTKIYW